MLDTLDPPTEVTGHAAHLRDDLTDLEAIELSLVTDDTKRCDDEDAVGSCPEGAAWRGTMPCGHGAALCDEHRQLTADWLARGDTHLTCLTCNTRTEVVAWRPL